MRRINASNAVVRAQDIIDLDAILTNSDSALAFQLSLVAVPVLQIFDPKRLLHEWSATPAQSPKIAWALRLLMSYAITPWTKLGVIPPDYYQRVAQIMGIPDLYQIGNPSGNRQRWVIQETDLGIIRSAQAWAQTHQFSTVAAELQRSLTAYDKTKTLLPSDNERYLAGQAIWLAKTELFFDYRHDLTQEQATRLAQELRIFSVDELIVAQVLIGIAVREGSARGEPVYFSRAETYLQQVRADYRRIIPLPE